MLIHAIPPHRRAYNGGVTVSGGAGGDGSTVATINLINTSGSTQAANFVTEIGGLAFKKGDVPSGSYPKLERATDATAVPATFWDRTNWSDGSWKRCAYVARVPYSIAGSATDNISVKNNGTAPAASSFTTANINASASRDFKVTLTGLENLTGTWTSTVNQGITDNTQVIAEASGPTCKSWRIEQEFRDGSSDHAHLLCRHYVFALEDNAGGVYGWYYMPNPMQPKMNTASPARRAATMQVLDGGTTLVDWDNAKTASYAGTNGRLTITAHGLTDGEGIKLTTTGTLPTGLDTTTPYFCKSIDANTVELWTLGAVGANGVGSVVPFTTTGTGTHTATRIIGFEHRGGVFGAQTDGNCHFVAGTGTRSTIRNIQDQASLKASKLVPPYNTAITPDAEFTLDYAPNAAGNLHRYIGDAGTWDYIALNPTWCARHFLRRDATSERVVRVQGLICGALPIWVFDETTRGIPVYNGGSYTGLPASNTSLRMKNPTNSNNSGINSPASEYSFFNDFDTSHLGAGPHYAYVVFGCPWYRDIIVQYALMSSAGRYTGGGTATDFGEGRDVFIGGTHYYGTGMFFSITLERVDAWTMREQFGSFLLPDSHPDGSQSVTFLRDLAKGSADAFVAWRNTRTAAYRSNGIYEFAQGSNKQGSPWARSYLAHAWAWGACISEDADIITVAQHFANYYSALQANGGIYHLNSYIENFNNTSATGIDNVMDDIALHTYDGYAISTNAGTDVVTVTLPAGAPAIADGDRIAINSLHDTLPGGMTGFQVYYVVQTSGSTCKFSATQGGSAIDITNSISTNCYWHHGAAGSGPAGSDGINAGDNYANGYTGVHLAAIKHLIAAGMTGLSSALTELQTIEANGTFDYVTHDAGMGPKNALSSSFT